jgi:hypothetical protein
MITKHRIEDFKKGWFIGNFEPSLFKTNNVEVAFQKHKKGDVIIPHYHRMGKEYTLIIKGKEKINGDIYVEGDIFIIEPYTIAEVEILEDLEVLVIKEHSGSYDKVEVK